jgi:hypothetical protein
MPKERQSSGEIHEQVSIGVAGDDPMRRVDKAKTLQLKSAGGNKLSEEDEGQTVQKAAAQLSVSPNPGLVEG